MAVKRLDISYNRAKADFESEGRLISNVHHRNLVRLLGCCSKGSQLLLIYEYMENGSLDTFLYGIYHHTRNICTPLCVSTSTIGFGYVTNNNNR